MTCAHAVFAATARYARKVNRGPRRFNRGRASRPLTRMLRDYWASGIDALFSFLSKHDGWEKIQQHVWWALAAREYAKAMSDSDRRFLAGLLASFGYYGDIEQRAAAIIEATSCATFEEAARFALRQLGVVSPDFELRNEAVRERLLARGEAAVLATRHNIDDALGTIVQHFYELGRNPYDQRFVDELREVLGYQCDWQARRFALTETGIAAEIAQAETYRRNGVHAKQWNILDVNTRPSHQALAGVVAGIDDKFDVGGFPADHPLDPRLPPEELCNCHCWLSPVLEDDFQVDPAQIWEGQ
ncbi:MAG: phage minor head protein [Bryobacteraceae bacterium]